MDFNLKPLISIGLSFYNDELFLEDSINSIINQTYSNWELILINDGSTDESDLLIQKIIKNNPQITYINDSENKGLIARLNQMIQISKGDFFVRFDADDIMFKNRLEEQLNIMQLYPDLDIVASSAVIIDEKNNITGLRESLTKLPLKLKSPPFIHPSVMGRIDWFKKNGYTDGYIRAEDFELWIRTYINLKFHTIKAPLIFYREGNINLKNYIKSVKTSNLLLKENYSNDFYFYYLQFIKNWLKIIVYTMLGFFDFQYLLSTRRSKKLNLRDKQFFQSILKKST